MAITISFFAIASSKLLNVFILFTNSEKCFDYMIKLECLDLTNNHTLIDLAVNSYNKHFFDEISKRDYTPYYEYTYSYGSVKSPKLDCSFTDILIKKNVKIIISKIIKIIYIM